MRWSAAGIHLSPPHELGGRRSEERRGRQLRRVYRLRYRATPRRRHVGAAAPEYLGQHPDGYRYSAFCVHYLQWVDRQRLSMRQVHTALKEVIRAETMAFYGRDLDKWLAGWAHDAQASRTLTGNGFYSAMTGWDEIAADMSKSMKADPTPIGIQLGIDDFIVHTSGDVAFVQYRSNNNHDRGTNRQKPLA